MSISTDGGGLRKRRTQAFVQVPSSTVRDPEISLRATGCLTFILDHPEGWVVRTEYIAAKKKEGREAVAAALRELRQAGYYRVERRRRPADGTFTMGQAVSEVPVVHWAKEYAEAKGKKGAPEAVVNVLPDGSIEDPEDLTGVTVGDGPDTLSDPQKPVSGDTPDTGPREPGVRAPGLRSTVAPLQTETADRNTEMVEGDTDLSLVGADVDEPLLDDAVLDDDDRQGDFGTDLTVGPEPEPEPELPPLAPLAVAPLPRCPKHLRDLNPPGCPDCRTARLGLEAFTDSQRELGRLHDAAEREQARRAKQLADAERDACPLCDRRGRLPETGLVCLHDMRANPNPREGGGYAEFQRLRQAGLKKPDRYGSAG